MSWKPNQPGVNHLITELGGFLWRLSTLSSVQASSESSLSGPCQVRFCNYQQATPQSLWTTWPSNTSNAV